MNIYILLDLTSTLEHFNLMHAFDYSINLLTNLAKHMTKFEIPVN